MFRPLNTQNSLTSNFGQVNDMVRQLNKESQTKVFKGPNNVNALISGKLPNDLGYGIQFSDTTDTPRIIAYIDSNNQPVFKISENGVNVTTASDDQLTFNSQQDSLKVVSRGTVTISATSSNDFLSSSTVTHSLGFVPSYIAFVTPPSGYVGAPKNAQLPFFNYVLYDSANPVTTAGWHINGLADVSNLTTSLISFRLSLVNNTAANAGDWVFTYYLLQETIS